MLFNSVEFLVFLPLVLGLYYLLEPRGQNRLLLVASWFFYGWWDWRFLALLGISSVVDYFCSRAIHKSSDQARRKRFLLVSLVINLGILGFFKYFNFFADSFLSLLTIVGFQPSFLVLEFLLPMGISFYTFQTMAYTIDVYRGKLAPTKSFVNFALYVSYFPQLVAGPIERATHLLPQIESRRDVSSAMFGRGLALIVIGYFKKVAVADVLAPQVDLLFSSPGEHSSLTLLLGVYLFAIQIYCDFSGYTDIARGVSRLMGIDLMQNFRHPYFSVSITEFWRRWHISLSTWLRDYLYIPLGGNRHGRLNTYRNLMITMLLGGLWHGASWNFVIWGGLHGIYLGVHKLVLESKDRITPGLLWPRRASALPQKRMASVASSVLSGLLTFHLVCLAWIFFRADNFSSTLSYLQTMALWTGGLSTDFGPWVILRILVVVCLLLTIDIFQRATGNHTFLEKWPLWAKTGFFAVVITVTLVFGAFNEEVPFIYFQF